MDFQLPVSIRPLQPPVRYRDGILLVGSCFTEHIGNSLGELKFRVLQNPNGILFDPNSVCRSLVSYIENRQYADGDLFCENEVWNSWDHHSRFSHVQKERCLERINESQVAAHQFLKEADWLIVSLGTAFSYRLTTEAAGPKGLGVANCHRAPAAWFHKHLMTIEEIISGWDNTIHRLFQFNPELRILFTISPVRHIRDGVIDNNRSKARLIESVQHLVNKFDRLYYFPAYELVIDVLRDYRFFDIDLVHPNYMATQYVMDQFAASCIDAESRKLMEQVRRIVTARKHRPQQPYTKAHQKFLRQHLEECQQLQAAYPFLDLSEELHFFGQE